MWKLYMLQINFFFLKLKKKKNVSLHVKHTERWCPLAKRDSRSISGSVKSFYEKERKSKGPFSFGTVLAKLHNNTVWRPAGEIVGLLFIIQSCEGYRVPPIVVASNDYKRFSVFKNVQRHRTPLSCLRRVPARRRGVG